MTVRMLRMAALVVAAGLPLALGCSSLGLQSESSLNGPGSHAFDPANVTCEQKSDCMDGEVCEGGVCQMQRCGSTTYTSTPPLGLRRYISLRRELVVVSDDKHTLDGYVPTDGSFAHPDTMSYPAPGGRVIDAAGGNLTGQRPEALAVITEGSSRVQVVGPGTHVEIELGFTPVAVAAGDVEGDGVDEIVVVGSSGDLAVCRADTQKCMRRLVEGAGAPKDVTVADLNGDGGLSAVILTETPDGHASVVTLDLQSKDAAGSPTPLTASSTLLPPRITGHSMTRIAAGSVDGGGSSIVVLEDSGFGDYRNDAIHLLTAKDGRLTEAGALDVAPGTLDVHVGDTDGDGKPELVVLERSGVEVFSFSSPSGLTPLLRTPLSATSMPSHVTMADLDGDSPAGTLVGKPEVAPGPVVPIAVLVYPPYSTSYSDGAASVGVGNREGTDTTKSAGVSLSAGMGIGFQIGITKAFGISAGAHISQTISRYKAVTQSIAVGERFSVTADPKKEGVEATSVVLACACYHAYTYRVEDPKGRLGGGGDGKLMTLFVPVGGGTSIWSQKRYNALAEQLKNLPVIDAPYVVGDPETYPSSPVKLDGTAIAKEDLLFKTPRTYHVSDVASTSWSLDVGETTSTADSLSVSVSAKGGVHAGPISLDGDLGRGTEASFTVSVGRTASFFGSIPPIRDDAHTPEDEHVLHGYDFTPIVYRDRYKTADGKQGGFFVVTYSVPR